MTHHNWKGDQASYGTVHDWMRNKHGTHAECEHCGAYGFIEYASRRKIYIRDLSEWLKLCRSCHSKYDQIYKNLSNFNAKAMERRKKTATQVQVLLEKGMHKRDIADELGISHGHVYFLIKQGAV